MFGCATSETDRRRPVNRWRLSPWSATARASAGRRGVPSISVSLASEVLLALAPASKLEFSPPAKLLPFNSCCGVGFALMPQGSLLRRF
jgi:hypothetical protein